MLKSVSRYLVIVALSLLSAFASIQPAFALDLGKVTVKNVEVLFSPSKSTTAGLVKFIGEAKYSIVMCAYEFTNKQVADALIAAAQRDSATAGKKVEVYLIADSSQFYKDKTSLVKYVEQGGVVVRYDTRSGIAHNKFMVKDGADLETGSFNYSVNAEKANAENIIILRGAKTVAEAYITEFNALWDFAKTAAEMPAKAP